MAWRARALAVPYAWPRVALHLAQLGTRLSSSSVPPRSASIRWSACVALRRLHQWQAGASRSSCARFFRYVLFAVRLLTGLPLPRFAWPSAFAALSCLRVAYAGRAHGLAFDYLVSELFREVCLTAVHARAQVDRRCVGELVFHGCRFLLSVRLIGRNLPWAHAVRYSLGSHCRVAMRMRAVLPWLSNGRTDDG